jgi:hypothetical protein
MVIAPPPPVVVTVPSNSTFPALSVNSATAADPSATPVPLGFDGLTETVATPETADPNAGSFSVIVTSNVALPEV